MGLDVTPLLEQSEDEAGRVEDPAGFVDLVAAVGRQFAWTLPQVLLLRSMIADPARSVPLVAGGPAEWESSRARPALPGEFPFIRAHAGGFDAIAVRVGLGAVVADADQVGVATGLAARAFGFDAAGFRSVQGAAAAAAQRVLVEGMPKAVHWWREDRSPAKVSRPLVAAAAALAVTSAHGLPLDSEEVSELAADSFAWHFTAAHVLATLSKTRLVAVELLKHHRPLRWKGGLLTLNALPAQRARSHDQLDGSGVSADTDLMTWWQGIWSNRHAGRPTCALCEASTGLSLWWPTTADSGPPGFDDLTALCHIHAQRAREVCGEFTAPGGRWEQMPPWLVRSSVLTFVRSHGVGHEG